MRHRQSGRQLNRNSSHRKALFMNMSNSLIKHELIRTTLPKAKELRRNIEPLITLSKTDNVANRRRAFSKLRNKQAVGKLFSELGNRFSKRPGGYVRVLKAGYRPGDNAPLAIIEFVDRLAVLEEKQKEAQSSKKEKDITDKASVKPVKQSASEKKQDVKVKSEPAKKESSTDSNVDNKSDTK